MSIVTGEQGTLMIRTAATLASILAISTVTHACNVPVFRYALERWRPDAYDAIVFHDGRLSPADSTLVQRMADASAEPVHANLRTNLANVNDSLPRWVRSVWTA